MCKRQTFQEFLGVDTEDAAANELCQRLNIQSRAELNGNARAKKEFDDLIKEYQDADPFKI
jgi:hypothetical protein